MSDNRNLPKGWVATSLAAVGRLYCGQSPSVSEVNHSGQGTPYVTGPDQWDGSTLTVDKWTSNPKRLVPDGCIFITVKGAGVGTLFAGVLCAIGRDVYAYEPAKELSRKFIEHSIRYNISQILRHAKGDIPGLSKDHILGHQTSFPPLNEQHRIVAKIEELFSDLDAGVAALKRAKANLKRYRAAVLKTAVEGKLTEEWRAEHPNTEPAANLLERILSDRRTKWETTQLAKFAAAGKVPPKNWNEKYVAPSPPDPVNLPSLPDSWCWSSVAQCASHEQFAITDGPFGSNLKSEHYTASGPRVIRLQNIGNGVFVEADAHISHQHFADLARHSVKAGDIVVAMLGETLPRACIVPEHIPPAIVKADCVKVAPNVSVIEPCFFVNVLNSHPTTVRASTRIAGVGRPRLNLEKLRPLAIPLPPLIEQQEIAAEVSEKMSLIDAAELQIENSLLRATALRQSILKQAFEGKLVAQDSKDEPASALLARIASQRDQPSIRLAIATTESEKKQPAGVKRKEPSGIYFRRGAIASYIVRELSGSQNFGRTQLEKVLHLTQSHLNVDLAMQFKRDAAGPFDEVIYKLEGLAKRQEWFVAQGKRHQKVRYLPGLNIAERCDAAVTILGDRKADLDSLLGHVAKMATEQVELFATVYAAWNDLLIDGASADNQTIIEEVYAWHVSKRKKFRDDQIVKCTDWMREHGYVPLGHGEHTVIHFERPSKPKQLSKG